MSILKNKSSTTPPQAVLYPVLTADQLLFTDPKRNYFMQKIQQCTGLEEDLYEPLYGIAIKRFAEMTQALPFEMGGMAGSLLDTSLEHAAVTLRAYHETAGDDFSSLYAYALFTAGLFQHFGKIVSQHAVMISDAEGKFVADWLPFEGSMVAANAEYYKLRRLDERWVNLGQSVTPLLARQCMPEPGFEWIASDLRILNLWVGVLTGAEGQADEFLYRLQLALKMIKDLPAKDRLDALTIEATSPLETKLGEEFLSWLNEGLKNNTIQVNGQNAGVHQLLDGGLLLEAAIFQQFIEATGRAGPWSAAARQVSALGLTVGGEGAAFEKFAANTSESLARNAQGRGLFFNAGAVSMAAMIREGMVISRPELLHKPHLANPANLVALSAPPPVSETAYVEAKLKNWEPPLTNYQSFLN